MTMVSFFCHFLSNELSSQFYFISRWQHPLGFSLFYYVFLQNLFHAYFYVLVVLILRTCIPDDFLTMPSYLVK